MSVPPRKFRQMGDMRRPSAPVPPAIDLEPEQPVMVSTPQEPGNWSPPRVVALGVLILGVIWFLVSAVGTIDHVNDTVLIQPTAIPTATREPYPPTPIPTPAPADVVRPGPGGTIQEGCEENFGYAVCDFPGGAQIKSEYYRTGKVLGRALSQYDPVNQVQTFDYGQIGYNPNEAEDARTQARNLGQTDLEKRYPTIALIKDAVADPLVLQLMLDMEGVGANSLRTWGHVISRVEVDPDKTGNKEIRVQWTERMRLEWNSNARETKEIRFYPLGQNMIRRDPNPTPIPTPTQRPYPPTPEPTATPHREPVPVSENRELRSSALWMLLPIVVIVVFAILTVVIRPPKVKYTPIPPQPTEPIIEPEQPQTRRRPRSRW